MDWTVTTDLAYLLVVVPLTVAVAGTLSRHGRPFLEDVLVASPGLATSVNRLLVVGFYLLNLGFVSLLLRAGGDVVDLRGLLEELSTKIGVVALVLGVLHLVNLYVFASLRRRQRLEMAQSAWRPPTGYAQPPYPVPGR